MNWEQGQSSCPSLHWPVRQPVPSDYGNLFNVQIPWFHRSHFKCSVAIVGYNAYVEVLSQEVPLDGHGWQWMEELFHCLGPCVWAQVWHLIWQLEVTVNFLHHSINDGHTCWDGLGLRRNSRGCTHGHHHNQIYYSNDTNTARGAHGDIAQYFLPPSFCPKRNVYCLFLPPFWGKIH